MKKIIPLLAIVICIAAACGSGRKKATTDSTTTTKPPTGVADTSSAMVYESLNGIDTATAQVMKDNFERSKRTDVHPTVLNFLLTKPMLTDIVKLLENEYTADTTAHKPHATDGMRIYFVKAQKNSPISLLLVSTIDSTGNRFCTHHDYYGHLKSETLYTSGISLQLTPQKPSTTGATGAELYHVSGIPDDPSCNFLKNPHYLHRKMAEQMVMAFHDHAVTTDAEWLPLDFLEDMNNETKCDGIRIYFATHPANDPIPVNSNRDGFVITTTHKDAGGIYRDYFDCQTAPPFLRKHKHDKSGVLTPGGDNGELCPTNCD